MEVITLKWFCFLRIWGRGLQTGWSARHVSRTVMSITMTIILSSLVSMDPVQSDLKRLGVKPSNSNKYNIHIPPFPGRGLCLPEVQMTTQNLNWFLESTFSRCLLWSFLEKVSFVLSGTPLIVHISISLRNILDIDELRQIITLETTMRLYWQDPRLNVRLSSDLGRIRRLLLRWPTFCRQTGTTSRTTFSSTRTLPSTSGSRIST